MTIGEVCYQVGCTPNYLQRHLPDLPRLIMEKYNIKIRQHLDRKKIQLALEKVVNSNEEPPPSLNKVGEQLGHTSQALQRHFPELCNSISQRYRSYKQAQAINTTLITEEEKKLAKRSRILDKNVLKMKLEAVIAKNEFPPPTLSQVVKEGGFSYISANKYCPDLCNIIKLRFIEYRKNKRLAREKELITATKQAIFDIFNEGTYPSSNLVEQRMTLLLQIKNPLLNRSVFKTWQETVKELGY